MSRRRHSSIAAIAALGSPASSDGSWKMPPAAGPARLPSRMGMRWPHSSDSWSAPAGVPSAAVGESSASRRSHSVPQRSCGGRGWQGQLGVQRGSTRAAAVQQPGAKQAALATRKHVPGLPQGPPQTHAFSRSMGRMSTPLAMLQVVWLAGQANRAEAERPAPGLAGEQEPASQPATPASQPAAKDVESEAKV